MGIKDMNLNSNIQYASNLINYNFKIGEVIKIFYLAKLRNKKRVYTIIGICYYADKKKFYIFNRLAKENIQMLFKKFSPAILKIFIVKMYKPFIFRITKIYFKRNLFLKEDPNVLNAVRSDMSSYCFIFLNFFISLRMGKKQKKKIIFKYKFRNDIHSKLKQKEKSISKPSGNEIYKSLIHENKFNKKIFYDYDKENVGFNNFIPYDLKILSIDIENSQLRKIMIKKDINSKKFISLFIFIEYEIFKKIYFFENWYSLTTFSQQNLKHFESTFFKKNKKQYFWKNKFDLNMIYFYYDTIWFDMFFFNKKNYNEYSTACKKNAMQLPLITINNKHTFINNLFLLNIKYINLNESSKRQFGFILNKKKYINDINFIFI